MAKGTKHNEGKVRFELVPASAEHELAKVMTFGAKKYGDLNWAQGLFSSELYAAMRRHLYAWWSGEDIDPESGLPHLAHLMANAAMALALVNADKRDFDDRKVYSK